MERKFNIAVSLHTTSGMINVVNNCNGFTFTNVGDTVAQVNGMIIHPGTPGTILGDSRSVGGNEGEIYHGNIKLFFQVPLGAAPRVELVQKFYVEDNK